MKYDEQKLEQRQRRIIYWGAAIILALFLSVFIPIWLVGFRDAWKPELITEHFAAVIGLPAAALCASCVVLAFRQAEGPIEFEILTLKLKGAAGPVVLWALCFFVIAAAVKLLW
jgi:hypothetical protein